jgi:molybdopterin molybdotransferase
MSAELLHFEEALLRVRQAAEERARFRPPAELAPLGEALGRVLAVPILADQDQPPFARSTRDGFAVRADEANRYAWQPIEGATHAGQQPGGPLPIGAAWEIMTGAPVPAGADAVAMVEHVDRSGSSVRLTEGRRLHVSENIVPQGAQARSGETLLQPRMRLGPAQIALAATCGCSTLAVCVRPRVAILTTGDELVQVEATPGPGQIRNSNAPMLAALVAQAGGAPWVLPVAADTSEALDAAFRQAFSADLLLISGGVSAGKFDLVEPALARLGARFHFTGVKMQPGKPLVFGELPPSSGDGPALPFFGLPGNPVSSAATFLLFGATMLAAVAGAEPSEPQFTMAQLASGVHGKPGLTRFLPARWQPNARDGEPPTVAPVPWQGSGDQAAFARANCFLVVPEELPGLKAGIMARILIFQG